MNPILPSCYYVPDVEARVWLDGRVYLYGSLDQAGQNQYCSREYRVFSSSNLSDWIDHGVSFQVRDAHKRFGFLYAPDCLRIGDRYCLFYCGDDGSEGLATSEKPFGPFQNAHPIIGADGDGIDPAAFLDDDGKIYYFWGQFNLRGARLKSDLSGIEKNTLKTEILSETKHGFHEGASIRKRKGLYYLIYTDISRGKATCLSYATSDSPLGKYEKRGVIIDNTGCDRGTWNNHGSICEFNGQWYVFYHRSSRAGKYHRRVCIEPIHFHDDGRIDEVEMTTQAAFAPLDATRSLEAYRACRLGGHVRSEPGPNCDLERAGAEQLGGICDGDWAEYKYFDFGPGVTNFHVRAGRFQKAFSIEAHLDAPDGPLVSSCLVSRDDREARSPVFIPLAGVHALYLVFRCQPASEAAIVDFRFSR